MNRYLEKIAELHGLEDGVQYDTKTHGLKISRGRIGQEYNRQEGNTKLVAGLSSSPYGAALGGIGGIALRDKMVHGSNEALQQFRSTEADRLGPSFSPEYKALNHTPTHPRLYAAGKSIGFKRVPWVAAALGAATVGGGVYSFASLPKHAKTQLKDEFVGKLEKRHDNAINKLEGWGDV